MLLNVLSLNLKLSAILGSSGTMAIIKCSASRFTLKVSNCAIPGSAGLYKSGFFCFFIDNKISFASGVTSDCGCFATNNFK